MNTQLPSRLSFAIVIAAALACNVTGVAETPPDATGTFAAMLTQVGGTAKAELPTQPAATLAPPTSAPPTIAPATNPPTSAAPPKPASTFTSAPIAPAGTASCVEDSKLIAHLTIPNGTAFAASTAFTKTWRVQNTGTCTWDTTYSLKFVGGVGGFGPGAIAIPTEVIPGSQIDLSVKLTSPGTAGSHSGIWILHNSRGNAFGKPLDVSIVVSTPFPPTVVSTPFPPIGVTSLGSRASDYAGNWFNNNVNPITGPAQFRITATSTNSISVQGWGSCTPVDCPWGTGTGTVSGTTITVSNFSLQSGPTVQSGTNVLSVPSSGALRAVRSGNTYDFHLGPVASDWVGTWTILWATNNITKIIIGVSGAQLTFHPYVKCTPSDCDWGTKNFAYNNPVSTGASFPHNLTVQLINANLLQIIDLSESTDDLFGRR